MITFGRRRASHVKTLLAFDSKTGKLRAWSRRAIDGWAASNIDETVRPAWLKRAEEAFRNDDGTAISRMFADQSETLKPRLATPLRAFSLKLSDKFSARSHPRQMLCSQKSVELYEK